MAGCGHAWNQPHPGRGRRPRLAPRRHVLRDRPGPDDRDTTFASTTTIRFTCREPGRHDVRRPRRRDDPRAHAQRRVARPGRGVRRQPDHAGRAWPPRTSSWSAPTAPTRARARDCTASSTPPTTGSTSTPSSRCPTPAACSRRSSSPTSRPRSRSRSPRRATGRWSPTRRRPSRPRTSATATGACGGSRRPSRCRRTSPRWSPASTTRSSTPTEGKHGDIPLGHYCRQSLVEHLDVDELVRGHPAGLRVLRGRLRLPVPVRQVRPALRAGVQHGRDGERRLRDAARRVPLPQPPGRRVLRVPRLGDPARDGPHVVRRPGDHEVVGRPVAERVVRRVGLLPRRRRGDRVHRVAGPASPTPARTGPTARTSCPPPTRSPPTTSTCARSR